MAFHSCFPDVRRLKVGKDPDTSRLLYWGRDGHDVNGKPVRFDVCAPDAGQHNDEGQAAAQSK